MSSYLSVFPCRWFLVGGPGLGHPALSEAFVPGTRRGVALGTLGFCSFHPDLMGKWWENNGKMMGKWWENDRKMMGKWCEHAIINHWDFEVWNDWTRHNPCIGWNHKRAMLRYIKRMMHLYASETWSRVTTIIMDISWVTWSRDQPVCGTSGWLLKYGNGNQSLTRSFPQTIDDD